MRRFSVRIVITALSIVVSTSVLTTVSKAESVSSSLTPFNLVTLAQRGYFINQGIPQGIVFEQRNQAYQLSARLLVDAAIRASRLPANTLSDRSYLGAVETQLQSLRIGNHGP